MSEESYHIFNKKLLLVLIILVSFTLITLLVRQNRYTTNQIPLHEVKSELLVKQKLSDFPNSTILCYRIKSPSIPDISELEPKRGKSIFFHETSCASYHNGKLSIGARQACAVESAAKLNPNFDVYLLYSSPGEFKFEGSESDRFLRALLTYKNVKINHLDYEKYVQNTKVEALYKNGVIESSDYALSHASDVLRYLTLWKYGGIYMDLDVVVIRSMENLPFNYAGLQSQTDLNCGVLSFDPNSVGHDMVESCLTDVSQNFSKHIWGANGPDVITRLAKKLCNVDNVENIKISNDCNGFNVYPTKTFYAVPYQSWELFFKETSLDDVLAKTKDSYAIHIWNKLSSKKKISLPAPNVPYVHFAQKFCPKVLAECDQYF